MPESHLHALINTLSTGRKTDKAIPVNITRLVNAHSGALTHQSRSPVFSNGQQGRISDALKQKDRIHLYLA
jgi:hypothetical protein